MEQLGSKVLCTQQLVLRPFRASDAAQAFGGWLGDPRAFRYLTQGPAADFAAARRLVGMWEEEAALDDVYRWAVIADGAAAGQVCAEAVDRHAESVRLSVSISPALWNRGLGTEALGRVIDFLFAEAGVYRAEARSVRDNGAACRVAEKCGMQAEGVLRAACRLPLTDERADVCVYAVVRPDWQTRRSGRARWVNAEAERLCALRAANNFTSAEK